jgi:TonB-dependent receptor
VDVAKGFSLRPERSDRSATDQTGQRTPRAHRAGAVAEAVRAALCGGGGLTAASAITLAMALSAPVRAQTAASQGGDQSQATSSQSAQERALLSEVVVTARRRAIMNADQRAKTSDTIVDSVVANEAGLLPDNSVTEILQRVSGVTMVRFAALNDPDHFSDEGSAIQIRGLSDVAARLNGRDVFSANNAGGLSFGDVTPELLKAVDVYKSVTSDLIEGGAGGQVDLVTRMPFDYSPGLKLDGSVNANYGDLAKKVDPGASLLATDRWQGPWGDFGALVDLAYSKLAQKDDFIRNEPYYKTLIGSTNYYIPGGYDYGFDQFERTRDGAYLGLQWAPTDELQVAETVFYSKYRTSGSGDGVFATSQSLAVDPTGSKFDSNNALVSSPDVSTRNTGTFSSSGAPLMYATGDAGVNQSFSDTMDASTTVEWKPSYRWDVRAAYQIVSSAENTKSYDLFDQIPDGTGGYALTETDTQPDITLPASLAAQYGNPANYSWHAHQDHLGHSDGQEHAANLDVNYDISQDRFFRAVQFGGRYSDRREQDADSGYNWAAFCVGWDGCNAVSLSSAGAGNVARQPFSNFFRGGVTLPAPVYLPSFSLANQYNPVGNVATYGGELSSITYPNGSPYVPYTFNPANYSLASSYDSAGYLMLRFANDRGLPFDGNIGLRYVRIENRSSGYFSQGAVNLPGQLNSSGSSTSTTLFPSEYYFRSGGRTTQRALPSVNIRLKPSENFFIRGAYTVTLDEPSFYDLRASGGDGANVSSATVSSGGQVTGYTSTTGNPTLRPMISHNWDLAFQWYPKAATETHLDFFYKTLDDTIVYGNTLQPVPFETSSGGTTTEYASVSEDFNAPQSATVKGAEIGGHTFFDMLPSPWNGLGVDANFTYVDSHNPGDQYVDISGVIHHDVPVVGLSKYNYNAELMYEKASWSARLAWSWRSRYLMTTNSNGTNGTYTYYSAPGVGQSIGISLPIYAAPYGELDFGLTYKPDPHVAVSLDFNNLTNETVKTLMGGYPNNTLYVRSWFTSDRRATLAVRYKFF